MINCADIADLARWKQNIVVPHYQSFDTSVAFWDGKCVTLRTVGVNHGGVGQIIKNVIIRRR